MSADAGTWLRSEDGVAWSLTPPVYQPTANPVHLYQHGDGDPAEDPCGRPPLSAEETAATGTDG